MARPLGAHAAPPQHSRTSQARTARGGAALAYTCAALLGLTLLSSHAVCGTYAKYVTSATGSDVARVAKFGTVTVTGGSVVNITGSSAMGNVTEASVGESSANGLALFAADAASGPVKVEMTRTEVAAKVVLTIKGSAWSYGINESGQKVMYYGLGPNAATVWFEIGDEWEYLANASNPTGHEFVFSREVAAGESLDASVMKYDRLYSSYTVEERAKLGDDAATGVASLTFSAQAIQID